MFENKITYNKMNERLFKFWSSTDCKFCFRYYLLSGFVSSVR